MAVNQTSNKNAPASNNAAPTIDFKAQFGNTSGNVRSGSTAAADDRPRAQLWLNVGVESNFVFGDDPEPRFLSLPVGIPLDTTEPLATNQRDRNFASFQATRNGLLQKLIDLGNSLEPGEEREVNLSVRIRKVEDVVEPATADGNEFLAGLQL